MRNNKYPCNKKQTTVVKVLRHSPKPIRHDGKSVCMNIIPFLVRVDTIATHVCTINVFPKTVLLSNRT